MAHERVDRELDSKLAFIADASFGPLVVTQFTFLAEPVERWLDALRQRGQDAHVRIGLAGPANFRTLLRFASLCGVTNSARAIARLGTDVARFLVEATPGPPITGFAALDAFGSKANISLHLFPFGGFKKTARWTSAVAGGRFRMRWGAVGFDALV
jgi:methylenetetrahydrofolate reductase (NADPH)